MAWVDAQYLDRVLGSTKLRQVLFAVDGTYSAEAVTQAELAARATVVSYLLHAGYADPGPTLEAGAISTAFLADHCAALMIARAYSRAKGIAWPPGLQDSIAASLAQLESMREQKLPVPGLTPSTVNGYGGVNVSRPADRPAMFSRSALKTWGA